MLTLPLPTNAIGAAVGPNESIRPTIIGCNAIGGSSAARTFGKFATVNYDEYPCFAFPDAPNYQNAKDLGEAASHAIGYAMGLSEKGLPASFFSQDLTDPWGLYFFNKPAEDFKSWAPIMGLGHFQEITQWSSYYYAYFSTGGSLVTFGGSTDELADLSALLGTVPDEDAGGAMFINASNFTTNGGYRVGGIIGYKGPGAYDIDAYEFLASPGPITIRVDVAGSLINKTPNLAAMLILTDKYGRGVATAVPTYPDMGVTLSATLKVKGKYSLLVRPVSYVDSFAPVTDSGWNLYGSLGRYSLSGSWMPVGNTAPYAVLDTDVSTGGFPLTVNFDASESVDPDFGGSVVGWSWDFGDSASPTNTAKTVTASHTYLKPGTYTASLIVTDNRGGKSVKATRVITVTGSAPNNIQVASINGAWRKANSVSVVSEVDIGIVDQYGLPLKGVFVYVNIAGTVNGKVVNVNTVEKTNSAGKVSVKSSKFPVSATGSLTYTVTSLVPPKSLLATYPTVNSPMGGSTVLPRP